MIRKIGKIALWVFVIAIIYLAGTLIAVEHGYHVLDFNGHIDYTSIRSPQEYGINAIETDLVASDGMKIHIYEAVAKNPRGVVIMLTGITGPSVTYFYGEAKLVQKAGFASILLEVRGHGKSDGDKATLGVDDVKDVEAVVNYINSKEEYQDIPIVIMGLSMGGATAVNAASLNDEIDGLIALSAFSSWSDACVDMVEEKGFPRFVGELFRPAIAIHGYINYGEDFFNIVPKETIKKIGDKPILFLRTVRDQYVDITSHDRIMNSYQGDNATSVIRDADEHFVVKNDRIEDPFDDREYCDAVLNFLWQFTGKAYKPQNCEK